MRYGSFCCSTTLLRTARENVMLNVVVVVVDWRLEVALRDVAAVVVLVVITIG